MKTSNFFMGLLNDIVRILVDIRNLLINEYPNRGRTYGFTLNLHVGDPVTKIYFSRYSANSGIPTGQTVFAPHRNFKTIILICEGLADIIYEVNAEETAEYLTSILRSGEIRQIDSDKNAIHSFACRAVAPGGPNAATSGDLTHAFLRAECIT